MRRWRPMVGVVGLLVLGAGPDQAWAGEEGTPLPETSGSAARPGAAPRGGTAAAPGVDAQPYVHHRREVTLRPTRLRDGTLRFLAPGWSADVTPDGAVTFRTRKASWRRSRAELSFDLTDAATRRKGGIPYAMEKLRFLEQTRAWRIALRDRSQVRWQTTYFTSLRARLARLWARRDLSASQKRHLVFLLWEECLEPGRRPLQVLAQRARRQILDFVRKHLPEGSPQGFTAQELGWMGRLRKGQEAFWPYGPPRPAAAPPGVKAPKGVSAPPVRTTLGRPPAASTKTAAEARRRAAPPPAPKPSPRAPAPRPRPR